jgi:hypothetical protein
MTQNVGRGRTLLVLTLVAAALAVAAGAVPARAQSETPQQFWHIPVWAQPGAWQDSTVLFPTRCGGLFQGPLPDSLREQARTITVRFLRNPRVEALPGFGGYRIFRVTGTPDTSRMMLIRRYSVNPGDEVFWHFSTVNPDSLKFYCNGQLAYDNVLTFVDPDSNGSLQKVCRHVDHLGRCLSLRDSVWALVPPPGPHDGFRTWYTVTYERKNTLDNNYEEWFVPDTTDNWARCGTPGDTATCPSLNSRFANMISEPVEPTAGPTVNLTTVSVVPNPFRAREAWDAPGGNEVHFINLPRNARIRIYSVDGNLVRELHHDDLIRDFEPWDLKNGSGKDVASGIYMYRVEAASFSAQNRFVVIR